MRDWRRSSRLGLIDLGFAELPWLPVKECLTSATTGLKLTLSSQSPLFKAQALTFQNSGQWVLGLFLCTGLFWVHFLSTLSSFYSSRFWSSMVRKDHVYMCSKASSHIYIARLFKEHHVTCSGKVKQIHCRCLANKKR